MERLRERLEELEGSLTKLEKDRSSSKLAHTAATADRVEPTRTPRKPNTVRPMRRGKGEAK